MTKEECKDRVLDLKASLDSQFENQLNEILEVGGEEMEQAENNYMFPRAVLAALLLKQVRGVDNWGTTPSRKVTITISKNGALMNRRY